MGDTLIDFNKFRNNLRLCRISKEITAKELSEHMGCKQLKRISDIEDGRGKPTLEEIKCICNYFGYSWDSMLEKEAVIKIEFN